LNLTDPISVKTAKQKDGLLSPKMFLMTIDCIMRKTAINNKTGIQWTLTPQLEDIDLEDGVCTFSHKQQYVECKVYRLAEEDGK
jgi:hypothetical protein